MKNRRIFLMTVAAAGFGLSGVARAQARLEEKDPQAVGLGYVHDATKVDRKKYPKYTPGQVCSNCALYKGQASDPWGGCTIFGAKQVAGPGWCTAWAKKA